MLPPLSCAALTVAASSGYESEATIIVAILHSSYRVKVQIDAVHALEFHRVHLLIGLSKDCS